MPNYEELYFALFRRVAAITEELVSLQTTMEAAWLVQTENEDNSAHAENPSP